MENGDKIKFTADISTLKTEMEFVRLQVSNHIPTSIIELTKANKDEHKELVGRLGGIEKRLAYWGGAIAVLLIVLEISFRFLQ